MAQTEQQREAFRKLGQQIDDELRQKAEEPAEFDPEYRFPVEDVPGKLSHGLSKFPDEL